MKSRRPSQTAVSVDGQLLGSFPTIAYSKSGVAVILPVSAPTPLQYGNAVTFQFNRATYSFPLTASRTGLDAVLRCYVNRTRSVATDSPPPSSETQPTVRAASSGTGFFVSRDGLVLTNAHVVDGCASIRVTDRDGATAPANVAFASDKVNDLALLRTRIVPGEIAALRRTPVQRGEEVAAFGYPLTSVLSSGGSFTRGDVSATEGMKDDTRHMQISVPVQPGNSGGPVVDFYGNVVGVVRHKLDAMKMAAISGDIPQNVNFAIKQFAVRGFLESKGIAVMEGHTEGPELKPTELAERARNMSVFIRCDAGPS